MKSRSPTSKKVQSAPKKAPSSAKKPSVSPIVSKKSSVPKKLSSPKTDSVEDKKVLAQILNIKIPEKFYSKPNLVLGDLVKAGDPNLLSGVTKAFYNAAANFVFGESTVINTLIKIITLIVSNAIPYEPLKLLLVSKILKIIKTAKATVNFTFTEIYLRLFTKKLSSLSLFKNFSFTLVLPIIIGSFAFYRRTEKEESILKYAESAANGFLSKNFTPFITETTELTGETNTFLVSEKIIKEGETIVRLEKLGINSPEISKLNPRGIGITFNPVFGSKKPINLRFVANVPYLDDSEKYLSGDVNLVKNPKELEDIKEKLTTLVKFYEEKLGAISSWYSNIQGIMRLVLRYDDLTRAIEYTIKDLKKASGDNKQKIEIYENLGEKILEEGLTPKGLVGRYGIPEQAISKFIELKKIRQSLLLSGINTKIKDHIQAILEANSSIVFVNTLRSNLNLINDTRKKLLGANRDIKLANLKNINLVSLRVEDATSVISSAIQRVKKYDTSNPVDFFKTKIEPIAINTQTKK